MYVPPRKRMSGRLRSIDSDLWVRFSGDCYPSCRCPLQLFRVVGGYAGKRSVQPLLALLCSLDQEKDCLIFSPWLVAVSKQFIPKFTLLPGSHAPCYKVCLSTSFLSRGLFRAGQTSAAKGIFAAHTGSLKKTGSFDWIQPAARLLAAVGNATKKKGDSVCGFIGVRWRRVGNPTKTKAKISPTFCTFTMLLRLSVFQSISECSAGKRVRPISCEQTTNTTVL